MDNRGWECPRCGCCYSPSTTQCRNCGPSVPVVIPTVVVVPACNHHYEWTAVGQRCVYCGHHLPLITFTAPDLNEGGVYTYTNTEDFHET